MTDPTARAALLLGQNRPDLAEPELRRALAADPDDADAHLLLAHALSDLDRDAEALAEADAATGLAPDAPAAHAARARALTALDRDADALKAVNEALALDPADGQAYTLRAALHARAGVWDLVLADTDAALALDPQHPGALNLRALALRRLRRGDEAAGTLDAALADDPASAVTHANVGWGRLERSEPAAALGHFREALRLDPTQKWAQEGFLEALKARNVVYRLFLRYTFWMQGLTSGQQWAVILGVYFAGRLYRPLAYVTLPLVLFTWLTQPLFTTLLLADPAGREALDDRERRGAWATAALLALALVLLGAALAAHATGHAERWGWLAWAAAGTVGYVLPVFHALTAERQRRRRVSGAFAGGIGVLGATAIGAGIAGAMDLCAGAGLLAVLGIGAYSWVANLLRD